jgi:hypothetical protein
MEKVSTPVALATTPSGVAAPTGAEYVVFGQVADADWEFLLVAANARAACVRDHRGRGSSALAGNGLKPPGRRAIATRRTLSLCSFLEKAKGK